MREQFAPATAAPARARIERGLMAGMPASPASPPEQPVNPCDATNQAGLRPGARRRRGLVGGTWFAPRQATSTLITFVEPERLTAVPATRMTRSPGSTTPDARAVSIE